MMTAQGISGRRERDDGPSDSTVSPYSMAEDLYQTLGVNRDATKDQIQRAYRKLALKYHPDRTQGDESARDKFKRVQEAYDVLSHEEKREAYNRYGADFEKIRSGGFRPDAGGASFEGLDLESIFGGRGGGGGGFENGFSDFFEQLRGARGGGGSGGRATRRRAQQPVAGENLRHELNISLHKAITGGVVEFYLATSSGRHKLAVTLPPGVESGTKMRLRGKGEVSPNGGPPGDLILLVTVSDHAYFRRSGKNLEMTLPVTLKEAALGAKIDVPTPTKTITLSIPPGTSSGKKLRLKGQGVDDGKGVPGDMIAQVQIILPKTIDDKAQQWIESFDQTHPIEPRMGLRW